MNGRPYPMITVLLLLSAGSAQAIQLRMRSGPTLPRIRGLTATAGNTVTIFPRILKIRIRTVSGSEKINDVHNCCVNRVTKLLIP